MLKEFNTSNITTGSQRLSVNDVALQSKGKRNAHLERKGSTKVWGTGPSI